jgi:hypothetical protein
MLLHVLTEFFLVRLLELIDYIVVLSVVIELLLELFNPLLELLLGVHDFETHLRDLVLVLPLDLALSVLHLGLVLLELLLRLLSLGRVPLLHVLDHRFHVSLLPRLLERVLLPGHHCVSLSENGLDFFFVGTGQGGLELTILLVF